MAKFEYFKLAINASINILGERTEHGEARYTQLKSHFPHLTSLIRSIRVFKLQQ